MSAIQLNQGILVLVSCNENCSHKCSGMALVAREAGSDVVYVCQWVSIIVFPDTSSHFPAWKSGKWSCSEHP